MGLCDSIQPPDKILGEEGQKLLDTAMWSSEPKSFDPMETALHEAYAKRAVMDKRSQFKLVQEYPLEGKPLMMTHVFKNAEGERIIAAKGAPEATIALSDLSESQKTGIVRAR